MRSPRQDPAASIQGIITDIRFGEPPDGWDVARVAREIDSEMPIVYVSGDSAPDWASKGVPNSLILAKPFAMAQLVTAISQLLSARKMVSKGCHLTSRRAQSSKRQQATPEKALPPGA